MTHHPKIQNIPNIVRTPNAVAVAVALLVVAATGLGGCPASDPGGSAATGGRSASSGGAGGRTAGSGGGTATGGGRGATGGSGAGGGAAAGSNGTGGTAGSATGTGGTAGATTVVGCRQVPGLLFCDDFETATDGAAPPGPTWTTSFNGSGKVTVDATTRAHSGTRSVHVSSNGGYQSFLELKGAPVFPAASTQFYLRLYIRLGAPMTQEHNTYFKAGAAATPSSTFETRIGVQFAMLVINQPSDRGFMSNPTYFNDGMKPGVQFPAMEWTCVEAFFDAPASTIDMWVNGVEVPALHRTDWQQDPIGAFRFGYEKYGGTDADIWYDDIAVGTQQVGCD